MESAFSKLGIQANIIKVIGDLNINQPTEIQEKAIPILLENKSDFIGLAKTGTGKTIAFGLPLLQLINPENTKTQAIILVPTRELGNQIFTNLTEFAKYLPKIKIVSTCGGIPIKPQIESLKNETHIVVATPGRLLDLISKNALDLKECGFLILDEADEMATALKESLEEIISFLPKNRKTW
ncbi:MAG: DEAD/DEAH box helicase, partial [Flavobacterium sp.]|nr:DEAD/DEAH box helicase [Flavobacterium sp.]